MNLLKWERLAHTQPITGGAGGGGQQSRMVPGRKCGQSNQDRREMPGQCLYNEFIALGGKKSQLMFFQCDENGNLQAKFSREPPALEVHSVFG